MNWPFWPIHLLVFQHEKKSSGARPPARPAANAPEEFFLLETDRSPPHPTPNLEGSSTQGPWGSGVQGLKGLQGSRAQGLQDKAFRERLLVGGVRGLRFKKGVTMRIFRIFLQEAFFIQKGWISGGLQKMMPRNLALPPKRGMRIREFMFNVGFNSAVDSQSFN